MFPPGAATFGVRPVVGQYAGTYVGFSRSMGTPPTSRGSPMTVPADLAMSELIDRFQDENQELALVCADGEVVGLVTAADAFEAITAELEDPLDRLGRLPFNAVVSSPATPRHRGNYNYCYICLTKSYIGWLHR